MIKKLKSYRPGPGHYAVAAALVLLVLLIPLLRIAFYSVPWYDDYNYGSFAQMAMGNGRTWGNALKGAWECIRISWYAWQGTYSSIFFMVLMPGIWGEGYYCFGPILVILLLTISVSTFLYNVIRVVFRAKSSEAWGIALTGAILAVELVYTSQQGFYWYNGGIHYLGMHSFMLLLVACVIRLITEQSLGKKGSLLLGSVLLAAVVAGGNFVTTLQGMVVLLSIALMGIVLHKRSVWCVLPACIVYGIGFFLNVSAPGNAVRADNYIGWGMSPVKSVLYSFVEGAKYAWKFTDWMTLAVLLFCLPLIGYTVKRSDFHFRFPAVFSLWSICMYATGFTPSLYSLGHAGLERTLNAVKLTWQMLLVLNIIYWCGYWIKKSDRQKVFGAHMPKWWFYPLIGVGVVLSFQISDNRAGSFSSYGAYYYVHSGQAYNFYQEYEVRVESLKEAKGSVTLKPYVWKPWMICMGDLSTNPKDEANTALAKWYDLDEVFLESTE